MLQQKASQQLSPWRYLGSGEEVYPPRREVAVSGVVIERADVVVDEASGGMVALPVCSGIKVRLVASGDMVVLP